MTCFISCNPRRSIVPRYDRCPTENPNHEAPHSLTHICPFLCRQTELAKRYDFLLVVGYCVLKSVFAMILGESYQQQQQQQQQHAGSLVVDVSEYVPEPAAYQQDDESSLEVTTEVQQILNKTKRNLGSISNLHYKLGLLETIFSFVFLSSSNGRRTSAETAAFVAAARATMSRGSNLPHGTTYFATAAITRALLGLLRETIDVIYYENVRSGHSSSEDLLHMAAAAGGMPASPGSLSSTGTPSSSTSAPNTASAATLPVDGAKPSSSPSLAIDYELQERIQVLRHRVKEAIWRLEVVTKNSRSSNASATVRRYTHPTRSLACAKGAHAPPLRMIIIADCQGPIHAKDVRLTRHSANDVHPQS